MVKDEGGESTHGTAASGSGADPRAGCGQATPRLVDGSVRCHHREVPVGRAPEGLLDLAGNRIRSPGRVRIGVRILPCRYWIRSVGRVHRSVGPTRTVAVDAGAKIVRCSGRGCILLGLDRIGVSHVRSQWVSRCWWRYGDQKSLLSNGQPGGRGRLLQAPTSADRIPVFIFRCLLVTGGVAGGAGDRVGGCMVGTVRTRCVRGAFVLVIGC